MDEVDLEQLVTRVIGCLIDVHRSLGPGFLESVYHRAVEVEFEHQGIPFQTQKEIALCYRGRDLGTHRLDLLVGGVLVVELKTVEKLAAIHYSQVRSYLKAAGTWVGLLANFAATPLDCRRVVRKK